MQLVDVLVVFVLTSPRRACQKVGDLLVDGKDIFSARRLWCENYLFWFHYIYSGKSD